MNRTRMVVKFNYQEAVSELEAWTDSDYAGCKKTRKSTSGGVIMHGQHIIKSWATTQGIIALSSGEAEYYGIVKGASIALGLRNLMEDVGVRAKVKIKTDAKIAYSCVIPARHHN